MIRLKQNAQVFSGSSSKQFYLLDASNCWKADTTTYVWFCRIITWWNSKYIRILSHYAIYNNKLPFETTDKDEIQIMV